MSIAPKKISTVLMACQESSFKRDLVIFCYRAKSYTGRYSLKVRFDKIGFEVCLSLLKKVK